MFNTDMFNSKLIMVINQYVECEGASLELTGDREVNTVEVKVPVGVTVGSGEKQVFVLDYQYAVTMRLTLTVNTNTVYCELLLHDKKGSVINTCTFTVKLDDLNTQLLNEKTSDLVAVVSDGAYIPYTLPTAKQESLVTSAVLNYLYVINALNSCETHNEQILGVRFTQNKRDYATSGIIEIDTDRVSTTTEYEYFKYKKPAEDSMCVKFNLKGELRRPLNLQIKE